MPKDRVPVEWWTRSQFAGRAIHMWFPGESVETIPIPDDEIVCDLCNATIDDLDPVPVIGGHALCADCCVRLFEFDPRKERPDFVEVEKG